MGVRFEKLVAGGVRGKGSVSPDGRIYLSKLSLSSGFLRTLPSLPSGHALQFDNETWVFDNAFFRLESSGSASRLRILNMKSSLLEIRGSVCWERGRLSKASLAGLLPASLAERLPEQWRQRLSPARDGKKMLKCAYKNSHLTFYGAKGRLLQATWSPGQSEWS